MKPSNSFAKSAFDRIFGVIGFVLLSPFLAVIALLVRLTSPGPVLFLQERVGKNGKPFRIMKFRTMVEGAEEMGLKITVGNDARVTRVGETLRKFKLDELPQILNIVKGEMSFVGPRPEVPKYVAHYTQEQKKVLSIKPGVTDLASIKYRKESELLGQSQDPEKTYLEEIMPEKLRINLDYVERASLAYDLRLLWMTVREVFFGN
ncbi:sugar transferase [Proteiniclasticum sp. QWL-01]|uniref:sugar transferase n=1 Tax=Proteiniclasticum sp. QWL-01 TaxID=3036945 RepID=UPI002203E5F6|nr:sugar transferase [Proteiniclasticum sp. QWL-01]UUM10580.1 sugar transferase [Clostridiaceae bacterium HFYG-1003]WFF71919.1 sugar transferase [Proteiniclasticum sp. QWL-01]